jgi:cell wall-associated NlpC family hydrolase
MQWKDERFTQLSTTSGLSGTPLERSDLIFFGSDQQDSSRVRHVGLALGDGRFIHCAGKGRGTIITPCSDSEFGESFVGASRLTKFPGLLASHEPSGP